MHSSQTDILNSVPDISRDLEVVAVNNGLPPIGSQMTNGYGIEWVVDGHLYVPDLGSVGRDKGSVSTEDARDLLPVIVPQNLSQPLTDFIGELDLCTSKILIPLDTMPHLRPWQAHPYGHWVDTWSDPKAIIFFLDAAHLHETIFAHEIAHAWIEFVEGCEDCRQMADLSDVSRVYQFQYIQSFVLDQKVNTLLRKRGFDLSVINADELEGIQLLAGALTAGRRPERPREAAFDALTIATALLKQSDGTEHSVLRPLQEPLKIIRSFLPEVYSLAEKLAQSVLRHGYSDREAVCCAIDDCLKHSFGFTGDPLDFDTELVERPMTEQDFDKRPGFFSALPVSAKLEICRAMVRKGIAGERLTWQLCVTHLGQIEVMFRSRSSDWTKLIVLKSVRLPFSEEVAMRLPTTQSNPSVFAPTNTSIPQITLPGTSNKPPSWSPFEEVPVLATRSQGRDYLPGIGRWLSRDPIGSDGGNSNPYVYVANDPTSLIDPDGLTAISYQGVATCFPAFGGPYPPFCDSNPDYKQCPKFSEGMTGAVPNVYYDWRQLHCNCPFHCKLACQPSLYGGYVKCGSTVTVSKGKCSVTITIIDIGPHAQLSSGASVDLSHKAYAKLYHCLNPKKKVPRCGNADPIPGVKVSGQADAISWPNPTGCAVC